MEIKRENSLTQQQIKEIRELEKLAYEPEQLENQVFLSNELNFNLEAPCFYLGYEGEVLISFLTTFMPTFTEAEILGFTHPVYRKQGHFKTLFEAAKETLLNIGISKVLWAVETKSESGKSTLKTFNGSQWEHSEHRMTHYGEGIQIGTTGIKFIKVEALNRDIFARITYEAFPDLENDSTYVDRVITSKDSKGYIVFKMDTPVGIFSLKDEEGEAFLYGVGIAANERGKGYGKEMIRLALEEGLKIRPKVVLDVDSENPIAFNLYKNCGFRVTFQVDYYEYTIK